MPDDHEDLDRACIAGARVVLGMAPDVKGVIVICVMDDDGTNTVTSMTHTKMPHEAVARALLSEAERVIRGNPNPTNYKTSPAGEIYRMEDDANGQT